MVLAGLAVVVGPLIGGALGGIAGMRERVRSLGGTFAVTSAPGAGTLVRVTLPTQVTEAGDE